MFFGVKLKGIAGDIQLDTSLYSSKHIMLILFQIPRDEFAVFLLDKLYVLIILEHIKFFL